MSKDNPPKIPEKNINVQQELFGAIKADDINLFSVRIREKKSNLALCYGRFPILTLCYLYNSRKIVKAFESELNAVVYSRIEEPYEVYEKFKGLAKTCLRLYAGADDIVSPLEMLAVNGDSAYIAEVYPRLQRTEKIKDNITRIYKTIHGQEIVQTENSILTGAVRIPKYKRLGALAVIVSASAMIIFSVAVLITAKLVFGAGAESNPSGIFTAAQLYTALNGDKSSHYALKNDIRISETWTPVNFAGSLDGNGKTIYIDGNLANGFINTLDGSIIDINFVFGDGFAEISDDVGLVVILNNGTVSGINVTVRTNLTEQTDNEELFFSCLVLENRGVVSDCGVDAVIDFAGDSEGNVYLSGAVARNLGTVLNCATTEN